MSIEKALAEAVVATTSQPFVVLDADLRIESINAAFCDQFKVSEEETEGAHLYDIGNQQWDIPELRRLLGEVLPNDRQVENFRVEHEFEAIGRRIMLLNARHLQLEGRPERILLAISDVTERENLIFELEGRKEFAGKLIDSVREGLLILHWDLRVHSANQSFYDLFQVGPEEVEGRLVYEIGNRQWDIPELRFLLEDILPENNTFDDFEVEWDFEKIGRRIMLLNGRRLDHLNLIVLAIRDTTEERAAAERQRTLTGELQHRVKNILNNVHAVAMQTRKRHETFDSFFDAFTGRLAALVRSQELLITSPTGTVSLRNIIRQELSAMGGDETGQIVIEGPTVLLPSRDAQTIGMMVHELATNACKYGALSAPAGRIEVRWRVELKDGERYVRFDWQESGVKIEGTHLGKGFGSEIIERSLPFLLGGTSELRFETDGVACHLEFPLPKVENGS